MDWMARFVAYAHSCFSHPLGYPDCNGFWGGVFLLGLCVLGIVAIRLIYRVSREEEQQAIEAIIKGHRPVTRELTRARKADEEDLPESAPYAEVLGKLRNEANKAKDAFP